MSQRGESGGVCRKTGSEGRLATFALEIERRLRSLRNRIYWRAILPLWRWKLRNCGFFDARWYLNEYPDVQRKGVNPLRHYILTGWKEGRNPGPIFDGKYYLGMYPDLADLNVQPLLHYWLFGRFEGREIHHRLESEARFLGLKKNEGPFFPDDFSHLLEMVGEKNKIQISVIIPTYNRLKLLPGLIAAWREVDARTKFQYEIIFSDDGSDDGSVDFLEAIEDIPIRVLANKHGGVSRARNAAIRAATGERLLIIGDDIFPDPQIINAHAVLGKRLGENVATLGAVDWHVNQPFNHLMRHITEIGNEQFDYNRLKDGSYVNFRHFYTCNICVSRQLVLSEKVFFDKRFTEYGYEDTELGYRLANRGMEIYFTTAATGAHIHPHEPASFCRRQISTGRMSVVFAELHPEVEDLIGIHSTWQDAPDEDQVWQRRKDLLVSRCSEYEHLIRKIPNDDCEGLRRCLSTIYVRLFRAMYEYGVYQKLGRRNPLSAAMITPFADIDPKYWSILTRAAGQKINLPPDELSNLAEALKTENANDLIYGQEQHSTFEELSLLF